MKEIKQVKVILRYKNKYLLLKKAKDTDFGHIGWWEVPGGKIKADEETIKALVREVKEETKLRCNVIKELKPLQLEKDNIKTFTRVYLAETDNDKVMLSEEHSDYRWVTYEDIDRLDNVAYKDLLKQYVREADLTKT